MELVNMKEPFSDLNFKTFFFNQNEKISSLNTGHTFIKNNMNLQTKINIPLKQKYKLGQKINIIKNSNTIKGFSLKGKENKENDPINDEHENKIREELNHFREEVEEKFRRSSVNKEYKFLRCLDSESFQKLNFSKLNCKFI